MAPCWGAVVVLVATPDSGGKVNRDPPVIGES
ncbi:hypothetical protein COLO4_07990 [Corchorus olitorius]|uniref:Uncharacterized protein n=1 Tax=Corchorus olitorius TaxID=93759 RepID=A0A1R3KHZ0_9ROSI|nr:hypothetical protein COLO4_07990 [Corchorus olitorius]